MDWQALLGGFVVLWLAVVTAAAMRFLWWVITPLKDSDLTIEDCAPSSTYQMDAKLDGPEHAALAIALIRRKAEATPEGRELMAEFDKLYSPREVGK